jgi:hypothetical protein
MAAKKKAAAKKRAPKKAAPKKRERQVPYNDRALDPDDTKTAGMASPTKSNGVHTR